MQTLTQRRSVPVDAAKTAARSATAKAITPDHVTYTDKDGVDHDLPAQSVILSVGMRAKKDEALSFYGSADRFALVGDCRKSATVEQAMRSAYAVSHSV